jgi:hypothetical protein
VTKGIGTWRLAEEYIEAGEKLRPQVIIPGNYPLYLLYGHGIELALKAFLISQGTTDKALRNIRHDLDRALRAARKHSSFIRLSKTDIQIIRWANEYYKRKEFEYLFTGFKSLPQPADLAAVAKHVLAELQPVIWAAVRAHTRQASTK